MTKRLAATLLILFAAIVALCGCVPQPFVEQVISTNADRSDIVKPTEPTRKLYVSGAVQNDGYIYVPQVCDYKTALQIVGLVEHSVVSQDVAMLIPAYSDVLIVNYRFNGEIRSSVNVNGVFVTSRLSIDGIEDEVIARLADYIEINGVISNRNQLKLALGDRYDENYYKFYIDVNDYA